MDDKQIDMFKEIWLNCIAGSKLDARIDDLKAFLYESLISRNDEILDILELEIPSTEGIIFLENLVNNFSSVEPSPLGFFPVGILKTKRLTCAGNALLANTILKNKGFDVKYARPASHSVNIVNFEYNNYWVDSTNGVFDEIEIEIEQRNTFSIAHVNTDSNKVRYKIVPIFEPQDVIINIFGNMEALKSRDGNDIQVKKYLTDNKEIFEVNFSDVEEYLYKEYFDYVRYDSDFKLEQKRIKEWVMAS